MNTGCMTGSVSSTVDQSFTSGVCVCVIFHTRRGDDYSHALETDDSRVPSFVYRTVREYVAVCTDA